MRYYTAVVKGNRETAEWAARRYAIEVMAVVKELDRETVIRVNGDDETWTKLGRWLGDIGECIEGKGYPDGELLTYSEHDDETDIETETKTKTMSAPPRWTSTVDYEFGESYWVDERTDRDRRYDGCITFISATAGWRVTETQWETIKPTIEVVK